MRRWIKNDAGLEVEVVDATDYDELKEIGTTLAEALLDLIEEYEDRKAQFGNNYLWRKHEGENLLQTAEAALKLFDGSCEPSTTEEEMSKKGAVNDALG